MIMNKISVLFFLSSAFFSSVFPQQTQNIFIIVIDGARYSETFGDPSHQYIPKIWNQLKPQGTIYTSFYNQGVTQTNSGHSSILTGTWQAIANDGTERPHKPTLFEYYRKETGALASENYVILGKDKLDILAYSDYAGFGVAFTSSIQTSTSQYDDLTAFNNIKTVINSSHPKLAIVNLAGTDRAGHDGPWSNYVTKLRIADSLVYEFWNFIQADPVYQNKTTVFVTNDHGRHLDGIVDGFRGHGDGCSGCRHISLLVLGPDTPAGITDTTTRTQIDIAPTVALLLKFNSTFSVGTLIATAVNFELPQTITTQVLNGWNIVSLPMKSLNNTKSILYPSSISNAFEFNPRSGYNAKDTLENGKGYWLKFGLAENISLTGYPIRNDTINVVSGWNLIGSITDSIATLNVITVPLGILSSDYYGYENGYSITDFIKPFRGYWIKVNQNGKLILNYSSKK
jgi:hypothetical protein